MELNLGHTIRIPQLGGAWVYNGVNFAADGTRFYEFWHSDKRYDYPLTLNVDEVVTLTR